jgi:uncharacterized metal-binding protein
MVLAVIPLTLAQLIWGLVWQEFPQTLIQLTWQNYRQETIALIVGLELGAMSHSLADWLSSYSKSSAQNKRKKKKRRKISNNRVRKVKKN